MPLTKIPGKSPATRSRQRKLPAVALPPEGPKRADRWSTIRNLHVRIAGRQYLIGPSIEGDPTMAGTIDGAATVEIAVRDVGGDLMEALGDEAEVLESGVTCEINGIAYALQTVSVEPGLTTLRFEDQVKDRLTRFTRFTAMKRTTSATFPQFVKRLVDEASRPPLARMGFFCPELTDKRKIPRPKKTGSAGRDQGAGAAGDYKVKGKRATAEQREVIDEALAEADRLGASKRVLIAVVMAITQESTARRLTHGDKAGPDSRGPFQQREPWGPLRVRMDPAGSTRLFLLGGRGGQPGWKQTHGSLKTAKGDLGALIKRVQVSVGGYSKWESEATKTVEQWLGSDGRKGSSKPEPYEFTRGERNGAPENSWDAIGRYAQERAWRRWAYLNTLWLVSDEELRAAAPSLELHGDEPWLLQAPSFEWNPNRAITEVRIRVLAERWGMQIGASVLLATGDPTRGRYLVAEYSGGVVSPEVEVTLRRPTADRPEPPNETSASVSSSSTSQAGGGDNPKSVARAISAKGYEYVWGGGHANAGTPNSGGMDCSGSVGAFLAELGHGFKKGDQVPASGGFASWGRGGKGEVYTVWYSSTHVWVEFSDGSRFDTSAHGDGPSGPRFRTKARSTSGFNPRHWPGF